MLFLCDAGAVLLWGTLTFPALPFIPLNRFWICKDGSEALRASPSGQRWFPSDHPQGVQHLWDQTFAVLQNGFIFIALQRKQSLNTEFVYSFQCFGVQYLKPQQALHPSVPS